MGSQMAGENRKRKRKIREKRKKHRDQTAIAATNKIGRIKDTGSNFQVQ